MATSDSNEPVAPPKPQPQPQPQPKPPKPPPKPVEPNPDQLDIKSEVSVEVIRKEERKENEGQ